jgi:putative transposase
MPRIARAVAVDYPHHVTQRGNYQQPVFGNEEDFAQYTSWLEEYRRKFDLSLWAYCLMNNHVHFICVPHKDDSLAKTFNTLHMRYSQYFNRKKGSTGHLWQGRFFSCILDERHLYSAVRYIENNPVRAKIVKRAEEYRWSSARGHIEKGSDPLLSGGCHLEEEIKGWGAYLREKEDNLIIESIRKNSLTGRPCGDDRFIQTIEGLLGRELKAKPWGRPSKQY